MAYEWITKYSSPNFGRDYTGQTGTNDPKYIVIHHWGEDSYTWDGTIATLCNGNREDNLAGEPDPCARLGRPLFWRSS